jgi:hypothetical protein
LVPLGFDANTSLGFDHIFVVKLKKVFQTGNCEIWSDQYYSVINKMNRIECFARAKVRNWDDEPPQISMI